MNRMNGQVHFRVMGVNKHARVEDHCPQQPDGLVQRTISGGCAQAKNEGVLCIRKAHYLLKFHFIQ
jgi:hypothetical protein